VPGGQPEVLPPAPAAARVADLKVRYLPYRELQANREAIMRFGKGLQPVEALTRDLSRADSTATPQSGVVKGQDWVMWHQRLSGPELPDVLRE